MKISKKNIELMLLESAKNKICNYCLHNGDFCHRGIPKYRISKKCKYYENGMKK
jgi:hypothetical protein